MTHRGPFQPLPFCDSVILYYTHLHRGVHTRMFADPSLCLTRNQLLKQGETQLNSKQSGASARGAGSNLPVAEANSAEIPREPQAWQGEAASLATKC